MAEPGRYRNEDNDSPPQNFRCQSSSPSTEIGRSTSRLMHESQPCRLYNRANSGSPPETYKIREDIGVMKK
jgi:hypothetical protein